MASIARKKSITGLYHIMNRAFNSDYIFKDYNYKIYFEEKLTKFKDKYKIKIISAAIMDNHYHIQIYDPKGNIAPFMRTLNSVFAKYYNFKNQRVGSVFQSIFKSKPIESLRYFYKCKEYIEYNPVEANMVEKKEDYLFSSACNKRILKYVESKESIEAILIKEFRKIKEKIEDIEEDILKYKEKLCEKFLDVKKDIETRFNKNIKEILKDKNNYKKILEELRNRTYYSRYRLSKVIGINYKKILRHISKTPPKY